MKNCVICGTLNLEENNYCTHCGCLIVLENICPFCGMTNPDSNSTCIKCHKQITPIVIDRFDMLFSEDNRDLIINSNLSDEEYVNILIDIFSKLDFLVIAGSTPKEKVLEMANAFTHCIPKSSGFALGETSQDIILYDDRLDDSIQIATIIHELAHYLLFDLVNRMLCNILKVKSSSAIKDFVDFFLTSPEIEVLNEYYAHTVENRFIPHEFQNFGSFKYCVNNLSLNSDEVDLLKLIANSYAVDIIHFLEKYIDEELRNSIKIQYKKDLKTPSKLEYYSFEGLLSISEKNEYLLSLLISHFDVLYTNEEVRNEVEYKNKF